MEGGNRHFYNDTNVCYVVLFSTGGFYMWCAVVTEWRSVVCGLL